MTTPVAGYVPLSYGLTWFAHGWRAFTRAPGLLIGVMILWAIVVIGLSLIPVLGSLATSIIGPALFGGYLLMCRSALQDSGPTLEQFFAGLTRRECRADAIVLGLLLLVAHILALILTTMAFFIFCLLILGGIPWDILTELEQGAAGSATLNFGLLLAFGLTLLVALIPYTAIAMAMTYAAPLVVDNRSTALSALAASFQACLRNILPLSVFALIYLVLAVVAMIPLGLGLLLFLPVSMAALAKSYSDIFPLPVREEGTG